VSEKRKPGRPRTGGRKWTSNPPGTFAVRCNLNSVEAEPLKRRLRELGSTSRAELMRALAMEALRSPVTDPFLQRVAAGLREGKYGRKDS